MKSEFTLLQGLLMLFITLNGYSQKGERSYEFDPEKSSLTWKAQLGEETFSGKFTVKSGYLQLKDKDLLQAVIFIDSRSFECINCRDEASAKKITEFVKSAAFLNTQNMDFAVFKMYNSESTGKAGEGSYRLEGNLTIIGYSNTIAFPILLVEKKGRLELEGKVTINRDLWHLNDPAETDENILIGKETELFFHIEGSPK